MPLPPQLLMDASREGAGAGGGAAAAAAPVAPTLTSNPVADVTAMVEAFTTAHGAAKGPVDVAAAATAWAAMARAAVNRLAAAPSGLDAERLRGLAGALSELGSDNVWCEGRTRGVA